MDLFILKLKEIGGGGISFCFLGGRVSGQGFRFVDVDSEVSSMC